MANADKNIIITPRTGQDSDSTIVFKSGADSGDPITLYATDNGTGTTTSLSFEGSAGQLFSVSNDLSGTIFSVNDVSGIPSIEVNDNGNISLAEFSGNVGIGTGSTIDTRVHVKCAGVNGILLDQDTSLGQNSSRLFFKTTGGTAGILGISGSLSFRRGMSVDNSSGTATINIDGTAGDVSVLSTSSSSSTTTGALTVDGGVGIAENLYVGGSITETSSLRYKENIREIDDNVILKLRPVLYDRKNGKSFNEAGFIAEEVIQVSDTLATVNEEGNPEGVNYTRIIAYLVDHAQKLEKRISELENG